MKQGLTAFIVGVLFGIGLLVSGMTQPGKVVGFLDLFGAWDPTLAFVMIGAIGVHISTYWLIMKRPAPVLAASFQVPTRRMLDSKLVIGSVLFGIGWGIAGFCPGPAIVSVVTLQLKTLIFVGSMAVGMVIFGLMNKRA